MLSIHIFLLIQFINNRGYANNVKNRAIFTSCHGDLNAKFCRIFNFGFCPHFAYTLLVLSAGTACGICHSTSVLCSIDFFYLYFWPSKSILPKKPKWRLSCKIIERLSTPIINVSLKYSSFKGVCDSTWPFLVLLVRIKCYCDVCIKHTNAECITCVFSGKNGG